MLFSRLFLPFATSLSQLLTSPLPLTMPTMGILHPYDNYGGEVGETPPQKPLWSYRGGSQVYLIENRGVMGIMCVLNYLFEWDLEIC